MKKLKFSFFKNFKFFILFIFVTFLIGYLSQSFLGVSIPDLFTKKKNISLLKYPSDGQTLYTSSEKNMSSKELESLRKLEQVFDENGNVIECYIVQYPNGSTEIKLGKPQDKQSEYKQGEKIIKVFAKNKKSFKFKNLLKIFLNGLLLSVGVIGAIGSFFSGIDYIRKILGKFAKIKKHKGKSKKV